MDTGKKVVRYVEESVWGTTPASALETFANASNFDIDPETGLIRSNALRGDYTSPFAIRTSVSGKATLPFELAYGDIDKLLAGVLRGAWTAAVTTTALTNVTVAAAGKTYTRAAGSFVTDGFVVGMWVKWAGFVNAANNGYHRLTAVSALVLTAGDSTLTDEAAGASVTATNSGVLRNGSTLRSFSLEENLTDGTGAAAFHYITGARPDSFSLNAELDAIVVGSFGFMGKQPNTGTATIGTGAPNAGVTTRVMSSVDNVTAITEAGAAVTINPASLNLTIGAPGRAQRKLGSVDPFGIGGNRFEIKAALRAYYDAACEALYTKGLDFTASRLSWRFIDNALNAYIVTLPALRYVPNSGPKGSGIDSDIFLDLPIEAETDSTTSCQIQFDRIAA